MNIRLILLLILACALFFMSLLVYKQFSLQSLMQNVRDAISIRGVRK